MKKIFCLLLTLMCLLLSACGLIDCALPKLSDAFFLRKNPLPVFDDAASEHMMNVMSGNRALVSGDRLYTLELDEGHMPVLAVYTLKNGCPTGLRVLAEGCVPLWLTELGGKLYYINEYNDMRFESLDLESGERMALGSGACSFLQQREGKLYYCDEAGRFCCLEPETATVSVVIGESCCYPFFIGDAIIYQSEDEGEILRLRFDEGGSIKEIDLTETAAYAPMVIGDRLYYSSRGRVFSMGLDGMNGSELPGSNMNGAAEYYREGGTWYARGISRDYGIRQWRCALPHGSAENCDYSGYAYCDYAGDGWRVESYYFSDARLHSFTLSADDGTQAEYLYGKVTLTGSAA